MIGISLKKSKNLGNKTLLSFLEMETTYIDFYAGIGKKKLIIIKNWILSLGFVMDSYPLLDSKFWENMERINSFQGYERLWRNIGNLKEAVVSANLNPDDYPFLTEKFWEEELKKLKNK